VDHLRRNPDELIASVAIDEDAFVPEVMALAEFAADLRAKPDPDKKREQQRPTKELPSRLAIQLTRLGACLAAVRQKRALDDEIVGLVRKVAVDTAEGDTLDCCRTIVGHGDEGVSLAGLATLMRKTENEAAKLLRFLRDPRIDVVRLEERLVGRSVHRRYKLTHRAASLWRKVMV
jgi:hypothetical protein